VTLARRPAPAGERRPGPSLWRGVAVGSVAVAAALLALPFVVYAIDFGWRGLTTDLAGESYLFTPGGTLPDAAIAVHMLLGGLVTLLAPVQLVGPLRRRARGAHRWTGRVLVVAATVVAAGGLAYIATRGTIGGAPMSAAFAVYGLLLGLAAVMTWRAVRRGDLTRHRDWALRFVVLALGSWFYRLHYTLWEVTTGGAGRRPDFSGPFDLAQLVAFWLPYLVLVELWIARHPRVEAP
jgi:hypothetical protein